MTENFCKFKQKNSLAFLTSKIVDIIIHGIFISGFKRN